MSSSNRTSVVQKRSMMDPSRHVTFNDQASVISVKKTKRCRSWRPSKTCAKKSLWYTQQDIQRFREEYRADRAGQRWIKQQEKQNRVEATWRSSPFNAANKKKKTKIAPVESRLSFENNRNSYIMLQKPNSVMIAVYK